MYGDQKTHPDQTIALAQRLSRAQRKYEARHGLPRGLFNTFMLSGNVICHQNLNCEAKRTRLF